MKTDDSFLDEILEAVEDGKLELSSWESDFVDSLGEQLGYRDLSRKQREILDKIHAKIRAW